MYQKDVHALKRRLQFFSRIPKLNWKLLDETINYNFRQDRLDAAESLGFKYISECTAILYFKHMSYNTVAKILKVSGEGINSELKRIGVKKQRRGGWRPGEHRAAGKRDLVRLKRPEIRSNYNGPFTG